MAEVAAAKMNQAVPSEPSSLFDAKVRVPDHVVFRDFVNETVVLNLQTGTYHGLNPTAGRMLTALDAAESVRQAAATLSDDYGWDSEVVSRDILALCETLLESGLIAVSNSTGA